MYVLASLYSIKVLILITRFLIDEDCSPDIR